MHDLLCKLKVKKMMTLRVSDIGHDFELSAALSGSTFSDTCLAHTLIGANCPMSCKRIVRIMNEAFQMEEGLDPAYETRGTFGTMVMHRHPAGVVKTNDDPGKSLKSCSRRTEWRNTRR
jgi:aldehyde:ferredoxin oxidoreductase